MFSLVGIISSLLGFVWYQQDMLYTSNPSYVVSGSKIQPSQIIPGPTSIPPTKADETNTVNTYAVLVLSLPNTNDKYTDDDVFASKSASLSVTDLPAVILSNIPRSEAEEIVNALQEASYRAIVVSTQP